MKRCTICGVTKPYSEFHKQASRRDGYGDWCKPCKSSRKKDQYLHTRDSVLERVARYRALNPDKVAASKRLARAKKICQYRERERKYYEENRESILLDMRVYRRDNWDIVLARNTRYKRERLRSDPLFRLQYSVRNRTFVAFRKRGYSKSSRTAELIGCSWHELMCHMSSKFQEGMTIDNYGQWHVDHIIPLSSAESEEELIRLCHYTNLQPLWAEDNIRKGASIPDAA